jgi:hypothetical protein
MIILSNQPAQYIALKKFCIISGEAKPAYHDFLGDPNPLKMNRGDLFALTNPLS